MTKRIDSIQASAIRKVFDKAATLKNVINLSIGQPDFVVPEDTKKEMIKAITENKTAYTPSAGIPLLKEKILSKYKDQKFAESVIVTSGVSGAIFLTYSALLEEAEEIIVFDPYFVMYPDLAKFLNASPIIVKTNEDFSVNINNLEKAITSKTKAIIINSPNNPTGYVYNEKELKEIAEVAKKNNLWIISDEVYEDFDYDKRFISMGKIYDKTIVMSGYSKNLSLTGLRIGYAVGPKEIIDEMTKLQQYTFVCAPSIAQFAVANSIDKLDLTVQIQKFKKRRDFVYENLKNNFKVIKPHGAFYFLIALPNGIETDFFIDKCLEKNLLIVPGYAFSKKGNYFRISYAVNEDTLKKGIEILNETIVQLKNQKNRK
jgi:aspartate/methionine/tyrosine aminotransferase